MCQNEIGIKVDLYDFEVILFLSKKLRLHNADILDKFLKDQAIKKIIAEKDDFDFM